MDQFALFDDAPVHFNPKGKTARKLAKAQQTLLVAAVDAVAVVKDKKKSKESPRCRNKPC